MITSEPNPIAEITFLVGDDDEGEQIDPSHIATVRCPHCQAAVSFVRFDAMLCCRCRSAMASLMACRRWYREGITKGGSSHIWRTSKPPQNEDVLGLPLLTPEVYLEPC